MAGDDEKKTERQQRIEALAALGEIGAGVTHEVRNVMTGILGFTQVAKRRIAKQPEAVPELLDLIEKESQRCVEILTHFLSFTRTRRKDRTPVDVRDVVLSVGRLMAHQLNMNRIRLEVAVDDDVPRVLADGRSLEQVLLNLFINAMQAQATTGGTVHVSARRTSDGSAEVEVRDDGPGVPPDVAARIFEPFFTTKPDGQGTGMGLAVSRRIVEEHGGTLSLVPCDHGAAFAIKLPGLQG